VIQSGDIVHFGWISVGIPVYICGGWCLVQVDVTSVEKVKDIMHGGGIDIIDVDACSAIDVELGSVMTIGGRIECFLRLWRRNMGNRLVSSQFLLGLPKEAEF
jgi:hypothetical protein